jgi:hypothetical protein
MGHTIVGVFRHSGDADLAAAHLREEYALEAEELDVIGEAEWENLTRPAAEGVSAGSSPPSPAALPPRWGMKTRWASAGAIRWPMAIRWWCCAPVIRTWRTPWPRTSGKPGRIASMCFRTDDTGGWPLASRRLCLRLGRAVSLLRLPHGLIQCAGHLFGDLFGKALRCLFELTNPLTQAPTELRQLVGSEDDQGRYQNHQQLRKPDILEEGPSLLSRPVRHHPTPDCAESPDEFRPYCPSHWSNWLTVTSW